jgi:hypothetical protein
VAQSGTKVTAVNASYNGTVSAGGSTTFGMTVNGTNPALSALTCASTSSRGQDRLVPELGMQTLNALA